MLKTFNQIILLHVYLKTIKKLPTSFFFHFTIFLYITIIIIIYIEKKSEVVVVVVVVITHTRYSGFLTA